MCVGIKIYPPLKLDKDTVQNALFMSIILMKQGDKMYAVASISDENLLQNNSLDEEILSDNAPIFMSGPKRFSSFRSRKPLSPFARPDHSNRSTFIKWKCITGSDFFHNSTNV
jgi:hypothetical protein